MCLRVLRWRTTFLPTPSARRATRLCGICTDFCFDFYPRPPRGGRPSSDTVTAWPLVISTHALREEGDCNPPYGRQIGE